jgi:hypothetical protein
MTVVTFPEPDRAKMQAEVLILVHELVSRAEEDPSAPIVGQIARRLADTSTRLQT